MGNCKSANTIDISCNHNKPHIAICLGQACTRDEGDRRLCEECLVDHMCNDRITIDDAIKFDSYGIQEIVEKFDRDQNSPNATGGLTQTLANFKNNFFESFKSYQGYYDVYLNQYLLQGIPDAEVFGEAASQIVEAFEKNDLGYIQKQGCQILLNTYNNPQLIKQIISNLDSASRKISIYQNQVEQKIKRLQDSFFKELISLPYNVSKQFNDSILNVDPRTYSYEFSAYLTTVDTNRTSGSLIQLNCYDHNQKIQVICCDRCPNKDNRLCGQCLITHKCNAGQRIKLKSFSQDQAAIIEAAMKYQKKKQEIQDAKSKVKSIFEEFMRQAIKEIELLGQNSKRMMCESQLDGIDSQIKLELPAYVNKLKLVHIIILLVVFANRSMVSLDQRGVAIIAYLIRHPEIKNQLNSFDATNNAVQYLTKLVIYLEDVSKRFLQNISQIEDIATMEKKPSQNLESSLIQTTNIVANYGATINPMGMNQSLQRQPSNNLNFQTDQSFENKIDGCAIIRVLKDFGEDQDNFVSDIIFFQNHLIVSTVDGLIVIYQGIGENRIGEYQFEGKCTSICGFIYKGKLAIAVCIGNFEEQNIGIVTFDKSISFQGQLQGHTDPILMVKQLIKPDYLVSCSGDHSIKIWDTSSNGVLENIKAKTINNHKMAVRDVILINNNQLVSGSFDETIQIYDLKSDRIIYAIQCEDWIYCLQNITEKAFAAGTGSGDIRIISTSNYNEMLRVRIAPNYIKSILVFQNPNYLFLSCKNRDNYIIRIQEYKQIDYITKTEEVDFVPEGICIVDNYIIYGEANTVKIKYVS
ncbi:unnamed protein product [Paramecium pentaurelia]|uniref:WD domain, G-beta repeat protein n=1 Tax=Paramecium pentaurelia TaxID=43138 RepID=A0A8S1XD87_9CILI|nr:unnamed protein product [Paramecium pentaurelia]